MAQDEEEAFETFADAFYNQVPDALEGLFMPVVEWAWEQMKKAYTTGYNDGCADEAAARLWQQQPPPPKPLTAEQVKAMFAATDHSQKGD